MPRSQAEVKCAHAKTQGTGCEKMPLRYAEEVVSKMHGRKVSDLPKKAKPRYGDS